MVDQALFAAKEREIARESVSLGRSDSDALIQSLEVEKFKEGFIIQGDILFPYVRDVGESLNAFGLPMSKQSTDQYIRGGAPGLRQVGSLWPYGVVPYTSRANVKDLVNAAIKKWEEVSPVRFITVNYDIHASWASFIRGNISASPIGSHLGATPVSLSESATLATAIHEIGHLLGLWHEHARHDRDNYVRVLEDNIDPRYRSQFDPLPGLSDPPTTYDVTSVMHYPDTMFAREPGLQTLQWIEGGRIPVNTKVSPKDAQRISTLYAPRNFIG